MPEPGELLGDHYRIVEVLSGGMGEVFVCDVVNGPGSAAQKKEKRPTRVALKTFQRRYFFDQAARLSFIREASALRSPPHPPGLRHRTNW